MLKDCNLVHKKKNKIIVLCSRPPRNVKLGSFSCSDSKEMLPKIVVLPI